MVELKCPSCSAQIELDNTREFGFCRYCGNKIMLRQKTTLTTSENELYNLVHRIDVFIEQNEFSKVRELVEKCINLYPDNYVGYWKRAEYLTKRFTRTDWQIKTSPGYHVSDFVAYDKDPKYIVISMYNDIKKDILLALKYTDDPKIKEIGEKYISNCENALQHKYNSIKNESINRLKQINSNPDLLLGLPIPPNRTMYDVRENKSKAIFEKTPTTTPVYSGIVIYNNTIYYRKIKPLKTPSNSRGYYWKGDISVEDIPITFDSNFYMVDRYSSQKILVDDKTIRLIAINEKVVNGGDYEYKTTYSIEYLFGNEKVTGSIASPWGNLDALRRPIKPMSSFWI